MPRGADAGSPLAPGRECQALRGHHERPEQRALIVRDIGAIEIAQRPLHHLPPRRSAEHFTADDFHHVLRQHAAHQRHFRRVGGVVQNGDRRPLAAAEKRQARGFAESRRDHDRDGDVAVAHRCARLVRCR